MIAGKGHETYQLIGTEKFYFDDREAVKKILENGE
jgi:UDP-N-acetylmuramoyl-L-alanyl-D-glutamate--2,6-diaminopimelate ligase